MAWDWREIKGVASAHLTLSRRPNAKEKMKQDRSPKGQAGESNMAAWNNVVSGTMVEPNDYSGSPFIKFEGYYLDRELIKTAALECGFRFGKVGAKSPFFIISSKSKKLLFRSNMTVGCSVALREITNDKHISKALLSKAGIRVAQGGLFQELSDAQKFIEQNPKLYVVKPKIGSKGNGITLKVSTEQELEVAWEKAWKPRKSVIVEEYIPGDDLRVMVVGGKAIGAIYRVPANVRGDGVLSISELVTEKNKARKTNPHLQSRPLKIDETVERQLSRSGLTVQSVPAQGETIYLNQVANLSAGGDSVSVMHLVHPSFLRIAEAAVAAFPGLEHAGVDLLAENFAADASAQVYCVCEINANNMIPSHHFPLYGPPTNAAGALISWYFRDEVGQIKTSDSAPTRVGRLVIVTGKVQRVGFRRWLQTRATAVGVSGGARNLGTNKLVVSLYGRQAFVDKLIEDMHIGPARAEVQSVRVQQTGADRFEI